MGNERNRRDGHHDQPDDQDFHAILTDCALPGDVSRVFDDYLTIVQSGASAAHVIVHKALLRS